MTQKNESKIEEKITENANLVEKAIEIDEKRLMMQKTGGEEAQPQITNKAVGDRNYSIYDMEVNGNTLAFQQEVDTLGDELAEVRSKVSLLNEVAA